MKETTACQHCGRLNCDDCDANDAGNLISQYASRVNDFAKAVDRLYRVAVCGL